MTQNLPMLIFEWLSCFVCSCYSELKGKEEGRRFCWSSNFCFQFIALAAQVNTFIAGTIAAFILCCWQGLANPIANENLRLVWRHQVSLFLWKSTAWWRKKFFWSFNQGRTPPKYLLTCWQTDMPTPDAQVGHGEVAVLTFMFNSNGQEETW